LKIRRRCDPDVPGGSVLQCQQAGVWKDLRNLNGSLEWLQNLAPQNPELKAGALPFRPLSFRDCMLYERHWVQASRGYVKRFMPAAYRLARIYEVLSRRTFPAFRPKRLWERQPIYYFGNHMTIVPSGAVVTTPSYTRALDYELELGWVLSKPLFNATAEEALAAIGGFVVVNDFSARDVQQAEMQSGLGPQKSKHFLSSMSQTMVTASEILPRINGLAAHVEINGQVVTRTSTRRMRYSVGEVLAHLSLSEHLYPGELIASGTLPNGSGIETDHWLQPGNLLRLVIEPIGEIVHAIR
jgi:2-keto-4-pentenoate hydratase/2-oxohepta-3-ene-1,7-dioic acid hydratase in catechol pathway